MRTQTRHWFIAACIMLACIILGVVVVGDTEASPCHALTQPAFAPSNLVRAIVAALYYAMIAVVLARALYRRHREDAWMLIAGVVAIMLVNEVLNVFLFRMGDAGLSFWARAGFAVILISTAWAAIRVDLVACVLLGIYLLWVGFDLIWAFDLMRLNPSPVTEAISLP